MKPFNDEIDFILEVKNGNPVGIDEAKYEIDADGTGHVKLIPAVQVFTFTDSKFMLSTWDCDNPLGKCVYDTYNDPLGDQCLFCGLPYERK
jgi:hypothetical protein